MNEWTWTKMIRNNNSIGKGEWMIVFINFLEYAGNKKLASSFCECKVEPIKQLSCNIVIQQRVFIMGCDWYER